MKQSSRSEARRADPAPGPGPGPAARSDGAGSGLPPRSGLGPRLDSTPPHETATAPSPAPRSEPQPRRERALEALSERDKGIIVGLLLTEGSFGGDGRQPQITLKMHVRQERLLRWLVHRLPRTKLYGPYEHGDRVFFQWMARGRALVQDVLPILEEADFGSLDDHSAERLGRMLGRYADYIGRVRRLG